MDRRAAVDPARWHFCIRDDDTNFFTQPEELERAYGKITELGPVSLAVVPFCRAGDNKAVPEHLRGSWSVHPLHNNPALVDYLRAKVAAGRFEIMLHGYYHDEPNGDPEFVGGADLERRAVDGRRYLEELLGTPVRVFVPPHNGIGRRGLRAIARAGLHLGGAAGIRGGWPVLSVETWALWWRLRRWESQGEVGIPWVIDLGDHREIAGNAVTPRSPLQRNRQALQRASEIGGVFCAATHYWEFTVPSTCAGDPSVGDHLQELIEQAMSRPGTRWESVGDVVAGGARLSAVSQ
jgi:peptidoglycan/xylan/chitin deacetylase (PgdA/CDA1 family)